MPKQKLQQIITPAGIAVYPWLNKPDTKFDDDGVYRVTLRVPEAEAQELVDTLQEAFDLNLEEQSKKFPSKGKKPGIKACADLPWGEFLDDDGNETGEIAFTFKMKAVVRPKNGDSWIQRPRIFDTQKQPLKDCQIGGGSTLKIAAEIYPWGTLKLGAGISLRLKAVQVLDLVEFGGRSAEGYGFEEEEGYVETQESFEEAEEVSSDY